LALQSAKPATAKPHDNRTALSSQLKNAKAGQAMSLQMVNGELKLTSPGKGAENKGSSKPGSKEVRRKGIFNSEIILKFS
jgi:hypothetical protein